MFKNQPTIDNHILSIVWLMLLILPSNQLFFLFVPIAYILLFKFRTDVKLNITQFIIVFLFLLMTTFTVNMNDLYIHGSTQDVSRLIIFALLFITFGRLRGNTILKPYICFATGFLVLSQFVYILEITPLKPLFSIYTDSEGYTLENRHNAFDIEYFGRSHSFRLGGIFINPNEYARYLGLIMLVLLCEIKQFSKKSLMILFPVIVISLMATGSRTSWIVFCATIIYYLYSAKVFTPQKATKISILLVALLFVFYLFTDISDMRMFRVGEGMDNSFGIKVELLMTYLGANPSMIQLLFGHGTIDVITSASGFRGLDWEIGNLILIYGILFMIVLFAFYFFLFKRYLPKYRVIFTILFWMFSSSVLLNYRMAALWILVLGLYYRRSLIEKKQLAVESNIST